MLHGTRPRAMQSTSVGDRNIAGSLSAQKARACVCWCTSVADVVAGDTSTITLHIPAKPELPPVFLRPPRVRVQCLRDMPDSSMPPAVDFDESQNLVRTAPTLRLRYGPLDRAGPFLLAVTIDGAHVAGSPFLLHCRPAPPIGESSSFDERAVVVRAGEVALLRLTTRDRFRNRCDAGGARVAIHDASPEYDGDRQLPSTTVAPTSTRVPPEQRVHYHEHTLAAGEAVEVVDNRDGTYDGKVLLRRAGVRRFLGSVDGVPFDAGAVELTVK
jgi:hypothetical protein